MIMIIKVLVMEILFQFGPVLGVSIAVAMYCTYDIVIVLYTMQRIQHHGRHHTCYRGYPWLSLLHTVLDTTPDARPD